MPFQRTIWPISNLLDAKIAGRKHEAEFVEQSVGRLRRLAIVALPVAVLTWVGIVSLRGADIAAFWAATLAHLFMIVPMVALFSFKRATVRAARKRMFFVAACSLIGAGGIQGLVQYNLP